MSSQPKSFNNDFTELFGDEQLCSLSLQQFIKYSLNAVTDWQKSTTIFKYWSEKAVTRFKVTELTVDDFQKIFTAFVDSNTKVMTSLSLEIISAELVESLVSFLQEWHVLFTHVKKFISELLLEKISILTECALRILQNYYQFLNTSKQSNNYTEESVLHLSKLLYESQYFQRTILSFMVDNFNIFICHNDIDVKHITVLINILCNVGELVPLLDVKSTAEIWKFISKITSENAMIFRTLYNVEEDMLWLNQPVKFLSEEIKNSVLTISEQPSNQTIDQVERILKINSFYLKLLVKFASDFEHQYFMSNNELIKAFMIVLRSPRHIPADSVNIKVSNMIQQYLTAGFMNLLNLIYKNRFFIMELSNEINNTSTPEEYETYVFILLEIFKLLISDCDSEAAMNYLVRAEHNHMNKLFGEITRCLFLTPLEFSYNRMLLMYENFCGINSSGVQNRPDYLMHLNIIVPSVFLNQQNYENLLATVCSLVISKCDNAAVIHEFENTLVKGILQNDILLANVCFDMWLLIARFIDSETRYKYFLFWVNCNNALSLNSTAPKSTYVENLVKSLYNFLPNNLKQLFWQDHLILNKKETKRTLIALGTTKILEKNKRELWKKDLLIEIEKFLDGDATHDRSSSSYYTVITNLFVLQDISLENGSKLEDKIANIISKLFRHNLLLIKYNKFLAYLLNFCSANNILTNNNLSLVLNSLDRNFTIVKNIGLKLVITDFISKLSKINNCSELPILNKLKTISKNDDNDSLLKIFTSIKSKQELILENSDKAYSINANNFFKNIPLQRFVHKCNKKAEIIVNTPKRIKLEETNPLLKNMVCDAYKIADHFKNTSKTESDIKLLKEIVNVFNNILQQ